MATKKAAVPEKTAKVAAKKATARKRPGEQRGETKRWQVIENVVAGLERIRADVPGTKVVQKAKLPSLKVPRARREVDVLVEVPSGGRTLRVAFDVKDEAYRLDTADMDELIGKRNELGLGPYYVVSMSGFTRTAKAKAALEGISLVRPREFKKKGVWAIPKDGSFIVMNGGHLHLVRFMFSETQLGDPATKALAEKMTTFPMTSIVYRDATGSCTLHRMLESYGLQYGLRVREGKPVVADTIGFTLGINMSSCVSLSIDGEEYPVPQQLRATIESTRTLTPAPDWRLSIDGLDMFTVEIPFRGELHHATMVAIPQHDGSHKLTLSVGKASPKQTNVG